MGVQNRHKDCWNAIRHDIFWMGKDYPDTLWQKGSFTFLSFFLVSFHSKAQAWEKKTNSTSTVSKALQIRSFVQHTPSTIWYHTWVENFKYSMLWRNRFCLLPVFSHFDGFAIRAEIWRRRLVGHWKTFNENFFGSELRKCFFLL